MPLPTLYSLGEVINGLYNNRRYGYPGDSDISLRYPSILKATDYFENPLGHYYLYASPHDHNDDCGVGLFYSDNLLGPWEFHSRVVADKIATPSVIWNAEEQKVYLYGHFPNGHQHLYVSEDGVHFIRCCGLEIDAHGYGQIFRYTLPSYQNTYCAIEWIGNRDANFPFPSFHETRASEGFRSSGLWISDDGKDWRQIDKYRFPSAATYTGDPDAPMIANCPRVIVYRGERYILFHGHDVPDGGNFKIWAYKVNDHLEILSYEGVLMDGSFAPSGDVVATPLPIIDNQGNFFVYYAASSDTGKLNIYVAADSSGFKVQVPDWYNST